MSLPLEGGVSYPKAYNYRAIEHACGFAQQAADLKEQSPERPNRERQTVRRFAIDQPDGWNIARNLHIAAQQRFDWDQGKPL
jgi:hypothetical protein